MKQAHEFGSKVQEMNDKLKEMRATGTAAAGMVTVEMNGLQEMVACKIDPTLFSRGDSELLEELLITAVNDAVQETRRQQAENMKSMSENVDLAELSETLGKFMPKS